jgi:peptide subunit release factor 1 (eRF1)
VQQILLEHFQAKWNHLATRKMRPKNFTGAFSSQVESLGGSEDATKKFYWSIFKPSGITWRLGRCDQKILLEYFQAKWNHLAARKMRPNKGLARIQ